MIRSFKDKTTARIANRESPKGFPSSLVGPAFRKLRLLHAATELRDLRNPPGNHLEALRGNRARQYSIRINDQWRICFIWSKGDAEEVEITDYH